MDERHVPALRLAALAMLGALLLTGCTARPSARFVDEDRSYTIDEVAQKAATLPPGPAADVKVDDAARVRQQVLAELRGHGQLASRAAELMTKEFPAVTKAVPFYVEAARVDGKPCWVIVETWGGRSGTLVFRRLWVFDRESGVVVDSRTYR